MSEEKKHHKSKKTKINVPWVLSVSLLIILIGSLVTGGFGTLTGMCVGNGNGAANIAIDDINSNLEEGQAELVKIENTNFITFSYLDKNYGAFISADGQLLTPPMEVADPNQQQAQAPAFDAPDTEIPTVELFVMSFCPYGMQAENIMLDVVDLLGDKVVIQPRFIVNVVDGEVQSLHGEYEANENMRQACIWKNYDQETFWNYIKEFNPVCNKDNLDTCWKEKAEAAGIDVATIETCFEAEGVSLMEADAAISNQYGVTGSPTLIINGEKYQGARTPEGYKNGICTGFATVPEECSQTLTGDAGTASGNC